MWIDAWLHRTAGFIKFFENYCHFSLTMEVSRRSCFAFVIDVFIHIDTIRIRDFTADTYFGHVLI